MIGKEVESEATVSLADVKDVLDERKKRRELTYEQNLAYEHAGKMVKVGKGEEKKMEKALTDLGVSSKAAIKILDVMPRNAMTLRQVLIKENKSFTDEEIGKILAVVKEHA